MANEYRTLILCATLIICYFVIICPKLSYKKKLAFQPNQTLKLLALSLNTLFSGSLFYSIYVHIV